MTEKSRQQGFTLVELLVVMAIMGIVVMAIYGLYQSNQRSNLKQDSVVELQQNLRVAMEQLRKDILLAGFMCPLGSAIQLAPTTSLDLNGDNDFADAGESGSAFTLATASSMGVGVRMDIAAPFESPSDTSTLVHIRVASPEMANLLAAGNYVRIIRPGDFGQPVDRVLTVDHVNLDDTSDPADPPPSVTLAGFDAVGTYRTGYMIVRVTSSGAANPCTIQYYLEKDASSTNSNDPAQGVLIRNPSDGSRDTLAANLTDLRFSYLLDDGRELPKVPPDPPTTPAQLSDIRAIRVTLTGATDATRSAGGGGVTTRTLSSVISLRNR